MGDILVAKTDEGKLIYLTGSFSRHELLRLRTIHTFYCPDCEKRLLLKVGDIKIPHFAHKSLSACGSSEPESSLHLQGKILLHQFFIDKNMPAEIEIYLPEIRQRADVLVGRQSVIEFQCSPISSSEVSKRSAAYSHHGLDFTWISGVKENLENKVQTLNMMEFQIEMLLQEGHSSYLLLLNPETQQFQYFSNLFHISGSKWVGKVISLPLHRQSYPFAVPKPLNKIEFDVICTIFANACRNYIKSQYFARKRYQNPFWLLCYKIGLDMQNLPQTIGVPIIGADCIQGHTVIWQLEMIRAYRQGVSIEHLLSSGVLKIHKRSEIDRAIKILGNYMDFLKEMEATGGKPAKQRDVLYDIYCKSVRKLRK